MWYSFQYSLLKCIPNFSNLLLPMTSQHETRMRHTNLWQARIKRPMGRKWPTGCSLPTPVLEPAWLLFLPIWATEAYLLDQTLQASLHSPHSLVSLDKHVADSSLLLLGPLLIYWPLQTDSTKKERVWHTNVLFLVWKSSSEPWTDPLSV